jgi:hypothetical protein
MFTKLVPVYNLSNPSWATSTLINLRGLVLLKLAAALSLLLLQILLFWTWSQSYKIKHAQCQNFGVGVITKIVYFNPIKLYS